MDNERILWLAGPLQNPRHTFSPSFCYSNTSSQAHHNRKILHVHHNNSINTMPLLNTSLSGLNQQRGCCCPTHPSHHHHKHHKHHKRQQVQAAVGHEIAQLVPHIPVLSPDSHHLAAAATFGVLADIQPAATAASGGPVDASSYTPGPVEVGWQIWFAAVVSTIPFVIGAYEFGKRIVIQRRCKVCDGSGLVQRGRYQRKCPECGGFFPWISWSMFLSANARPGNGGPLLQPRGQTSVFYSVPPAEEQQAGQQPSANEPAAAAAAQTEAVAATVPQGSRQNNPQRQQQEADS